jgi:hypothetical protein
MPPGVYIPSFSPESKFECCCDLAGLLAYSLLNTFPLMWQMLYQQW